MKGVLFIVFFCFLFIERSKNDKLRDYLMKAQIGGSRGTVGLGQTLEGFFIGIINWFPRISVWNFKEMKYQFHMKAPKRLNFNSLNFPDIIEFVESGAKSVSMEGDVKVVIKDLSNTFFETSDIPDFVQGIIFTTLGALILTGVWAIFAYQSHLGLGYTINTVDDNVDSILDFADNVLDIPNSFSDVIEQLEKTFNDTIDQVIRILPIGDALLPHIQCVKDIVASLPDINAIGIFVEEVDDSLSNLPSFDAFDHLSANITKWLDKMKFQDLAALKDELNNVIDTLDSIPPKLRNLKIEIGGIDKMKTLAPPGSEIDQVKSTIDEIDYVQKQLLTDTFVNDFTVQLNDLSAHNAQDVAANIRKFQSAVNILSQVDFASLNDTFGKFGDVKNNVPDVGRMIELIDDLSLTMDGFDLSGVSESLVKLNDSIFGLVNVIDGIDVLLDRLNSSVLAMIPDFSPLFFELNKIDVTIATAKCIRNITRMIIDFNSSVVILPPEMSEMINMVGDMEGFLNDVNFDSVIGSINGMKELVDGQLQSAMISVGNMSADGIVDQLPDIKEIQGDVDDAVDEFESGSNGFNITEMEDSMKEMNSTVNDFPEVSEYQKKIGDMENSTQPAVEQNDTITAAAVGLKAIGPTPCTPSCAFENHALIIKGLVVNIKESSDAIPTSDLYGVLDSFNDTMNDLPDSAEFISKIESLNDTLKGLPDMNGIKDQIVQANETLNQDLPFGDFSSMIDQFSGSISDFNINEITGDLLGDDGVGSMYDMINQSDIFDNFNILNDQIDPMIGEVITMLHSFDDQIRGIINMTGTFKGYLRQGYDIKEEVFNDYIYKYDGYRLLAALLVILALIPIPCLGFFCCCCSKKPGCLLIFSYFMVFGAAWLFMPPAIGIPVGIGLNDGCSNLELYVSEGIDTIATVADNFNLSNFIPPQYAVYLNISYFAIYGITSDFVSDVVNSQIGNLGELLPNMTMDLSFDFNFNPINVKSILMDYISQTEPCAGSDVLDIAKEVFNSSVYTVMNGFGEGLKGFSIMGFQIHPKFPDTLKEIFMPGILNFTIMFDIISPLVGCEPLNEIYNIGYDMICAHFRYSFIYFWGICAILGIIIFIIGIQTCCIWCCFEHCFTTKEDDKRKGKPKSSVGDSSGGGFGGKAGMATVVMTEDGTYTTVVT